MQNQKTKKTIPTAINIQYLVYAKNGVRFSWVLILHFILIVRKSLGFVTDSRSLLTAFSPLWVHHWISLPTVFIGLKDRFYPYKQDIGDICAHRFQSLPNALAPSPFAQLLKVSMSIMFLLRSTRNQNRQGPIFPQKSGWCCILLKISININKFLV